MDNAIVGAVGMALIAIGWARQAWHTLKARKSGLRLRFSGLYLLGSALLAYYSISINDWLFATLNVLAGVMAAIEFYTRARQEKYF